MYLVLLSVFYVCSVLLLANGGLDYSELSTMEQYLSLATIVPFPEDSLVIETSIIR
jgi:hypothetical protein